MEEIYKKILLLIHSLTRLSGICYKHKDKMTEESVDEIAEIVNNSEEKFLKVKEEIIRMVQETEEAEIEKKKVENIEEIRAVKTENGFLIKE